LWRNWARTAWLQRFDFGAVDRAAIAQNAVPEPRARLRMLIILKVTVEAKSRGKARRSRPEGIVPRHARSCPSHDDGRCRCAPTFQAQVWSARDQKTIRKTFATISQAKAWRQESQAALRKGTLTRLLPSFVGSGRRRVARGSTGRGRAHPLGRPV
jgi:hypothetical protein